MIRFKTFEISEETKLKRAAKKINQQCIEFTSSTTTTTAEITLKSV